MKSKTVRLNFDEKCIIFSALGMEQDFYEKCLKRLTEMNTDNLEDDKRADRDMLISSYMKRLDMIEKLKNKI